MTVLPRTTSSVGSTTDGLPGDASPSSAISASSGVVMSSACSATGWRTEDYAISSEIGWSSNPITAMSSGTRSPAS